jgi:hypothetical protein
VEAERRDLADFAAAVVTGAMERLDSIVWTCGDGPEAHGTAEALLMAMCGRAAAGDDLTDPVGSTATARSMGDADWRTVLDHHDRLIDRTVRRFGGTVVKATGDGALTIFELLHARSI